MDLLNERIDIIHYLGSVVQLALELMLFPSFNLIKIES